MKYIATSEEMQKIDKMTIEKIGIPGLVLMERAADAIADEICLKISKNDRVFVVVEGGNNGGDGLAIARILNHRGYKVEIGYLAGLTKQSESFLVQLNIVKNLGISIFEGDKLLEHLNSSKDYAVYVDGIFGVGLKREVQGVQAEIIELINKLPGLKIAIDVPSGIDSSSGKILGTCFKADLTYTVGLMKRGLVLYPGAEYAGQVKVLDIGFPKQMVEEIRPEAFTFEQEDLDMTPIRRNDSNKGTYGRVSIIAGSSDMAGALIFAARAAYKMGAGLVKVYTHKNNRDLVLTQLPESLLMTYDDQESAVICAEDAINYGDAILIGPGLGNAIEGQKMLSYVVLNCDKPLVIDADGLNILSSNMDMLKTRGAKTIVTPHLKEMERLSGIGVKELKEDICGHAKTFASYYNVCTVLKDARTAVSMGTDEVYINTSGNPGMSTAGAGDVLAGIITALVAQKMPAFDAACLGVYIHGRAGDAAMEELGRYAMIASDIADSISKVVR